MIRPDELSAAVEILQRDVARLNAQVDTMWGMVETLQNLTTHLMSREIANEKERMRLLALMLKSPVEIQGEVQQYAKERITGAGVDGL